MQRLRDGGVSPTGTARSPLATTLSLSAFMRNGTSAQQPTVRRPDRRTFLVFAAASCEVSCTQPVGGCAHGWASAERVRVAFNLTPAQVSVAASQSTAPSFVNRGSKPVATGHVPDGMMRGQLSSPVVASSVVQEPAAAAQPAAAAAAGEEGWGAAGPDLAAGAARLQGTPGRYTANLQVNAYVWCDS
jgi:hypothetical protein